MRLKEESLRQLPPIPHSANNSNKKRYPDRWKSRCDFSSSSTCLWPVHCLLVLQTTTTKTVGEEAGNHGRHIDTNSCNSLFIQPPLYFQVWICCTKRWLSRHLNRKGAAVKTEKGRKRRPCLSLSLSLSHSLTLCTCVCLDICVATLNANQQLRDCPCCNLLLVASNLFLRGAAYLARKPLGHQQHQHRNNKYGTVYFFLSKRFFF